MIIKKSQFISDWFVLTEFKSAQPEGTSQEWLEIIKAMKARSDRRFRRVAVWFDEGFAFFNSPRNSVVDFELRIEPNNIQRFIDKAEKILSDNQ